MAEYAALFTDRGPSTEVTLEGDLVRAHELFDSVSIPTLETLSERIVWVARRWGELTTHAGSCGCTQCAASRQILRTSLNL